MARFSVSLQNLVISVYNLVPGLPAGADGFFVGFYDPNFIIRIDTPQRLFSTFINSLFELECKHCHTHHTITPYCAVKFNTRNKMHIPFTALLWYHFFCDVLNTGPKTIEKKGKSLLPSRCHYVSAAFDRNNEAKWPQYWLQKIPCKLHDRQG